MRKSKTRKRKEFLGTRKPDGKKEKCINLAVARCDYINVALTSPAPLTNMQTVSERQKPFEIWENHSVAADQLSSLLLFDLSGFRY